MNLKAFPMDFVSCKLTFESFNYNNEEVHMHFIEHHPIKVFVDLKNRYRGSFVDYYDRPNSPIKYMTDFILVNISANAVVYVCSYYIGSFFEILKICLNLAISSRALGRIDGKFHIPTSCGLVHITSLSANIFNHIHQLDIILFGCWYCCKNTIRC